MKKLKIWEDGHVDVTETRRIQRVSVRSIAHSVMQFFNLERGLLLTIRDLALRPGTTIIRFLDADRFTYTNPFKYYLISVSIYLFLYYRVFDRESATDQPAPAIDDPVIQIFISYMNIWLVIFAFFVSLFSYLLFRKKTGFNLAENLVLNIAITAQIVLLTIIFMLIGLFNSAVINIISSSLLYAVTIFYTLFSYKQFFGQTWIKTVFKTVASVFLATLLILFLVLFAGIIHGFVGAYTSQAAAG
ncbi:DUF3667 domain-containing protein [Natronogracilivirga saccharolytica]|uniref:DUF3667 domain-containing protein n=1 Tax=Natronogracilivirga saccharolytica TaxID=2812953 RepID=A0A8J7UWD1_9BACT|nr:DUF3667 domain-containing protein [Natronogracilivirga saccharolytica]MBP3193502.1 DUF3667 domain-containing protein [Natronogracilivirga saccharolytica]